DKGITAYITTLDIRSRFDIYIDYEDRFKVYLGDMENAGIKLSFLVGIIDRLYSNSKGTIDISDYTEATYSPR
ncbi:MAG: hypothetical protein J5703_00180, partial [Methanomicrobium sp.]|nr:hypothetical protein [Methanomicrobium sp.]